MTCEFEGYLEFSSYNKTSYALVDSGLLSNMRVLLKKNKNHLYTLFKCNLKIRLLILNKKFR